MEKLMREALKNAKPYPRPEGEPYPKVWLKFEGPPDKDGRRRKFIIQDLTEEYFEKVLAVAPTFISEELTNKSLKSMSQSIGEEIGVLKWNIMLKQGLSLVCLTEDEEVPQMTGFNLTEIVTKQDFEQQQLISKNAFDVKVWAAQARAIIELKTQAKLFERFNSDRYMDAMGLYVFPEFRKNGIAEKLLACRVPLCKMIGIKGTANTFSSHPVRRLASKVGYEVYTELSMKTIGEYAELEEPLPDTEFVKVMGMKIE